MVDGLWYVLLSEMMVNIAAAGFIAGSVTTVRWRFLETQKRSQLTLIASFAAGIGALLFAYLFRKVVI